MDELQNTTSKKAKDGQIQYIIASMVFKILIDIYIWPKMVLKSNHSVSQLYYYRCGFECKEIVKAGINKMFGSGHFIPIK